MPWVDAEGVTLTPSVPGQVVTDPNTWGQLLFMEPTIQARPPGPSDLMVPSDLFLHCHLTLVLADSLLPACPPRLAPGDSSYLIPIRLGMQAHPPLVTSAPLAGDMGGGKGGTNQRAKS